MQSFIGTLNFYRRLIKRFLAIVISLIELIKKSISFSFEKKCRKIFKKLKYLITLKLILKIFDLEKEVILETNASNKAIKT